jgi:DNA-binding response OmpR family regulator
MKILVVEDLSALRSLYRQELESEGYSVVTSANGQAAFEAFDKESPDLVVLDVESPDPHGFHCMGRMLTQRREVPILLNTSYPACLDTFASWAADACVIKSSDTAELRSTIRQLLGAKTSPARPAQPRA